MGSLLRVRVETTECPWRWRWHVCFVPSGMPDPKEKDEKQAPPSEQVANAHAAGDGALERSGTPPEEGLGDDEQRAEDQNHIPY